MKFKVTLVSASIALLFANSSWAEAESSLSSDAYYTIEEISVDADGAVFGPFPVAMSEDGEFIATYSMKAALSADIDIGLPFTFNRTCQYADEICEFEFYGSENVGDLSYENAYQAWRNAEVNVDDLGYYEQYMFANTLLSGSDEAESPFWTVGDTTDEASSDIKVTDVTDSLDGFADRFVVGYASAPYANAEREFVRRAYIKSADAGVVTSLAPEFTENGGFSSAYKLQQVTYTDSEGVGADSSKTLVIGAASRSYPGDDADYFDYCYNSTTDEDDYYDMIDLVLCPGFDTQAWAWDITDITQGEEQTGFALATEWLEGNTENENSLTFSANAFDMNASGIAVGTSTFAYGTDSEGARQRAIIMTPTYNTETLDYEYGAPVELTEATADIGDTDDQEQAIYNTWALTISDSGIVTGNREYAENKSLNQPIEFFIYDNETGDIKFPLEDLKVATTRQRLESGSYYVAKSGANSRIHDANESGWMVGEVDDYDAIDPVDNGKPRTQTAFIYDNNSDETWLINDLLCTSDADGVISLPNELYRIRSARVINDAGVVLADGYSYPSEDDYVNLTNARQVAVRLTPNENMSPNDSPNCWQAPILEVEDELYERQGGATFWLMLLALPLVFIRRFKR